jgi:molybdate transport system permease protein
MDARKTTLQARILQLAARLCIGLLVAFLALPLVSLVVRVPPGALLARMREPVVLDALQLSLITSACSTLVVVVLGLPVAYLLATRDFRGRRLLETLIDLPMVLPPTVAGVGLLLAFGRAGLTGGVFQALGVTIPFTTLAVVFAQVFVAAPFFVATTAAGLSEVEPRYLDAAATLRASPAHTFFRVLLPLSLPSLVAGAAMSWARALGEFGATITFAGNLPRVTQTMPLAVYMALQTDLEAAVALSVLLLVVSFVLLLGFRALPLGPGMRRKRAPRDRR